MRYPALPEDASAIVVWSCFRRALIWAAEMVQGVLWAGAESALLVVFLFFPFPPLGGPSAGLCSQMSHIKTQQSAGKMSNWSSERVTSARNRVDAGFSGRRAGCPVSCVPKSTHKEWHIISRALS